MKKTGFILVLLICILFCIQVNADSTYSGYIVKLKNEPIALMCATDELSHIGKNLYYADNKYALAVDNYKKALKYTKDNAYVHYNLACAYIKLAEIKKAKAELIKAVTIKNDIADIHYNLAYVYKCLNKPKLAQTYLDNYNKLTNQL